MFSIAHCVRWMERPKKNFSDEIFPHFVWKKNITGIFQGKKLRKVAMLYSIISVPLHRKRSAFLFQT